MFPVARGKKVAPGVGRQGLPFCWGWQSTPAPEPAPASLPAPSHAPAPAPRATPTPPPTMRQLGGRGEVKVSILGSCSAYAAGSLLPENMPREGGLTYWVINRRSVSCHLPSKTETVKGSVGNLNCCIYIYKRVDCCIHSSWSD